MPNEGSVRVRCPHCQRVLSVPVALQGKSVKCPHPDCQKPIALRMPTTPAMAAAPAPLPPPLKASPVPSDPTPQPGGRGWGLIFAGFAVCASILLGGVVFLVVVALRQISDPNTPKSVVRKDDVALAQKQGKDRDAVATKPRRTDIAPPKAAPPPTRPKEETPPTPIRPKEVTPPPPKRPKEESPPTPIRPPIAPSEGLELPPVGATKPAAGDPVAQEFKAARAVWMEVRKKARVNLRLLSIPKRAEIQKSDLDAKEKAKSLQDLLADQMAFAYGPGKTQDKGPLHTHPAMKEAVADYWRTIKDARRKFGEVAVKGLADYEKAGVTDPAKLRPLLAAKLASQHADLVGIWATGEKIAAHDVWIVDVDESSGGWQIEGSLNHRKGFTGSLFHGDNITFKDGTLSFTIGTVDSRTRKVVGAIVPATLTLRDGELRFDGRFSPKPIVKVLRRTEEEAARESIEYWGIPKPAAAASDTVVDKPDPNNPNYVWRSIAGLSSFPFYRGKSGLAGGEQFYIPYRSKHPTLSRGPYGGLADMLLGRAPGAGRNQGYAEALFRVFDSLAESPHPYLKRAGGDFLALSRARFQLAEADELFGNTPNSSIREFQQKVFIPAGKYAFQREADRAELEESLRKEHPDLDIVVVDAPLSAESRRKLNELVDGASGLMEDVKQRAVVSGLLAYADMAQVDRAAALWRTWLLPLAKRCGGPPSTKPLLAVEGDWKLYPARVGNRFMCLNDFRLRNVSGQDLSNAVVEMIAENEWGEKAAHYYYFYQLEVSEVARLVAHPRWDRRRLPFTNTITVTWSVWADQGSEVGRQVKLTNPTPNPDPAGWRKDYLAFDAKYQAQGEALGTVVRNFRLLPVVPARQRRHLLDVAAPKTTYVVRPTGPAGRPLVIRFLRLNADEGTVEAEVFDLVDRKPFRPDTPIWKGKLTADPEAGYVLRMDAGWTFLIAQDDRPNVSVPASPDLPAKQLPMVRIKLP